MGPRETKDASVRRSKCSQRRRVPTELSVAVFALSNAEKALNSRGPFLKPIRAILALDPASRLRRPRAPAPLVDAVVFRSAARAEIDHARRGKRESDRHLVRSKRSRARCKSAPLWVELCSLSPANQPFLSAKVGIDASLEKVDRTQKEGNLDPQAPLEGASLKVPSPVGSGPKPKCAPKIGTPRGD